MAQSILELNAFLQTWEEKIMLGILAIGYVIACAQAARGPRR